MEKGIKYNQDQSSIMLFLEHNFRQNAVVLRVMLKSIMLIIFEHNVSSPNLYMYLISGDTRPFFAFLDFCDVFDALEEADPCAHLMESRLTAAFVDSRAASLISLKCWLSTPAS